MKFILVIVLLCVFTGFASAHESHYRKVVTRHWIFESNKLGVDGSFLLLKDGQVFIEAENGSVAAYPLKSLSKDDRAFALQRSKQIEQMVKHAHGKEHVHVQRDSSRVQFIWMTLLLVAIAALGIYAFVNRNKARFAIPVLIAMSSIMLFSFTEKGLNMIQSLTDPAFLDSAFSSFKPYVTTRWDNNYFYVESNGIPTTHEMMVGISSNGWQQQVPIPQCYVGTNSWQIPLNPTLSDNPIPVDATHFTRGAIALAVNGVPIFNVHTNTGVDSYLDGQLDNFGGHCGRADDYHYHTAPLHLYNYTSKTLPVAFGLDGYAVYGSVEPDGTPMQALDANHGHAFNGTYHYHGTATAPYMIARMAGVVTEDATKQLIPQPSAKPVRPDLTPLKGALIKSCIPNKTSNGYTLTYTLNGQTDSIVYSWNSTGEYVFKFYTLGNGTATTSTYNGFSQCALSTSVFERGEVEPKIQIFPNPNNGFFQLRLFNSSQQNDVKSLSINNVSGESFFHAHGFQREIDIHNMPKGMYILHVHFSKNTLSHKFIVQ